jgi:hypothetical protein
VYWRGENSSPAAALAMRMVTSLDTLLAKRCAVPRSPMHFVSLSRFRQTPGQDFEIPQPARTGKTLRLVGKSCSYAAKSFAVATKVAANEPGAIPESVSPAVTTGTRTSLWPNGTSQRGEAGDDRRLIDPQCELLDALLFSPRSP